MLEKTLLLFDKYPVTVKYTELDNDGGCGCGVHMVNIEGVYAEDGDRLNIISGLDVHSEIQGKLRGL